MLTLFIRIGEIALKTRYSALNDVFIFSPREFYSVI